MTTEKSLECMYFATLLKGKFPSLFHDCFFDTTYRRHLSHYTGLGVLRYPFNVDQ